MIGVRFVLALAVIVMVARMLARLSERVGQPAVLGEIIAGLVLGPSFFGALAPALSAQLFPPTVMPLLSVYAQVGVVLYMFLVGAELTADALLVRGRAAVVISLSGILLPLVLGVALAAWLAPGYAPARVPFPVFASFIGLSLSVTALAVLARLLRDWRIATTPLGTLALASAALSDATALSLLAVLSGYAHAEGGSGLRTAILAIAFLGAMVGLVAPGLRLLARRREADAAQDGMVIPVLCGLALSAFAAHHVGVEALIGAFLFGALLPRTVQLPASVTRRLDGLITVWFLPAFFALTGLRTRIGLLSSPRAWLVCLGIIAVATIGKGGGTWVASRLVGLGGREALSLAVLMNTRGLVELVVLNVGLELGILTPTLFTMLVVMALITTFAAPPFFRLVAAGRSPSGRATG